ncbi:ABC transporter permease [Pseudoclavibacter sp. AY1H1]|uniref:ABC transporter permease n=1 Tax=Pseudoclavibacter sp. AY1H1 TaxID=2080584 RepID=UPI000CE74213|nr:ABC transporter permease [Pseudoclavibacter sp. AY1H1]PPF34635.1 ABC transporter [Pseudoclavibacter sp. AY1H1]
MSTAGLIATHVKYSLIETARVPIAVIGSLVFPTLAFCFFVLPQSAIVDDPAFATQATASMIVFAFMTNGLFSLGLDLAEQRSKPWVPYLRTLPGKPSARIAGLVISTLVMATLAIIPLLVVGGLFTAADPAPMRVLLGLVAVVLTAIPSALIGAIVGTTAGPKAAIAITQVLMFLLAFGGGLFLPPFLFPDWLDSASKVLPVRQARELVIATVSGSEFPVWALLGILAWTAVLGFLAVFLYKRDEGRKFS